MKIEKFEAAREILTRKETLSKALDHLKEDNSSLVVLPTEELVEATKEPTILNYRILPLQDRIKDYAISEILKEVRELEEVFEKL